MGHGSRHTLAQVPLPHARCPLCPAAAGNDDTGAAHPCNRCLVRLPCPHTLAQNSSASRSKSCTGSLLLCCRLSGACTCRSFGVLLWEMLSGRRAWAGLAYVRVVQAVAIDGKSPQFPDSAPADYAVSHARQCRTKGASASCTALHPAPCSQIITKICLFFSMGGLAAGFGSPLPAGRPFGPPSLCSNC